MPTQVVSGEILFDRDAHLPPGAKIHITLLETSRVDSPAEVVAEETLSDAAELVNQGKPVPFILPGAIPDPQGTYTVSVHVDVSGSGQVGVGDFITTQSYPVLTSGNPSRVKVQVQEVTR